MSGCDNYSLTYTSNSWAFNGDTREFDVIENSDSAGIELYIVKRNTTTPPNKPNNEKQEMSITLILIITFSIVAGVTIVGLIVFFIRKHISKTKINNYVSTLSDHLIDI